MKQTKTNPYYTRKIEPAGIRKNMPVTDLIDECFTSFNARNLRNACRLFVDRILSENTTIGLSVSGALTPAGLGRSCLAPLIQSGYVDWIVSTGANLYHDMHASLGYAMYEGSPAVDDRALRENDVIRIYDIYFKADALFDTDRFIRDLFRSIPFEQPVSSAEVHSILGHELLKRWPDSHNYSVLAAAAKLDVPVHTSSPGDSSIGMNLAGLALEGKGPRIDPCLDVNLTAAWVYHAKKNKGRTAAVILGGGSPKNFLLQTEPQIQEVLGLKEAGQDYFIQFTDARVDTGGLSGATPSEAVTWGKIDPAMLPHSLVCYGDCSVYLPLFTAYALNSGIKRKPRRLWKSWRETLAFLEKAYRRSAAWGQ